MLAFEQAMIQNEAIARYRYSMGDSMAAKKGKYNGAEQCALTPKKKMRSGSHAQQQQKLPLQTSEKRGHSLSDSRSILLSVRLCAWEVRREEEGEKDSAEENACVECVRVCVCVYM